MKCHVCGNKWKGSNRYCARCGTPAGTDRRRWSWALALLAVSVAVLIISIVMASSPALAWKRLPAPERAEVGRLDAQLAQIEEQLQHWPEEQEKVLHQIGDESRRPYFDAGKNQELQDKLREAVQEEQRLTDMKAELEARKRLILKGGKGR